MKRLQIFSDLHVPVAALVLALRLLEVVRPLALIADPHRELRFLAGLATRRLERLALLQRLLLLVLRDGLLVLLLRHRR